MPGARGGGTRVPERHGGGRHRRHRDLAHQRGDGALRALVRQASASTVVRPMEDEHRPGAVVAQLVLECVAEHQDVPGQAPERLAHRGRGLERKSQRGEVLGAHRLGIAKRQAVVVRGGGLLERS